MFGPNADLHDDTLLHVFSCLDMCSRLRLVSSSRQNQSCSPFALYSPLGCHWCRSVRELHRAALRRYSESINTELLFEHSGHTHKWASWRVQGLVSAIERAFRPPTNLKSLSLYDCGVTHEIVPGLLPHVNRELESLNLGSNRIGDEGMVILCEALKSNSTLKELNLHANNIGPVGAQSLANMLQFNTSLTSLDLSDNGIQYGGAEAVAAALPQS